MSQDKGSSNASMFDIITVVFVILTVAVLGVIVLIINDPNMALNPFPPPTAVPIVELPTLTPSPTVTPTATPTTTGTATATPSATLPPTDTPPPTATVTPTPTATQVLSGVATETPAAVVPTSLPPIDDGSGNLIPGSTGSDTQNATTQIASDVTVTRSPFPFTADPVRYEANTGDQGCQWLSIAGTIIDLNGRALTGLAIEINGDEFHNVQFSGSAARWGRSGFEFNLGAAPRTATYTLRVLGPTGGPISDLVYVDTGNTCQSNVAIVDFIQNHPY
jgi:cytoskeletal protein RodZ